MNKENHGFPGANLGCDSSVEQLRNVQCRSEEAHAHGGSLLRRSEFLVGCSLFFVVLVDLGLSVQSGFPGCP
jgi:hypothetical protein